MSRSVNYLQDCRRQGEEDYASYVGRISKLTSMVEGPHFPNFQAIGNSKNSHIEKQEQTPYARTGRFGLAVHLQRFDQGDKGGSTAAASGSRA